MPFKINGCYNHVFKRSTYRDDVFQRDYVIFDVETKERKLDENQKKLTFKLISYIFVSDFEVVKKGVFLNLDAFWNEFFAFVKDKKNVICINNNMGFDIRSSNAFHYLQQQSYVFTKRFYMKNATLIINFIKTKQIDNPLYGYINPKTNRIIKRKYKTSHQKILFLDMQNYFAKASVKEMGEVINLEKLEIDFDSCSMEELSVYAVRDCEIVWEFFHFFLKFLIDNQLVSRLRNTIASLSISTFRTRFLKDKRIFIHNSIQTIKLEKQAYRGGITDVFLKDKSVECTSLDVNSMYAFVMKFQKMPTCLMLNVFEARHSQKELFSILNDTIISKNKACMAEVTYSLHEGYLLTEYEKERETITCNLHGSKLRNSFCQPELEYIQKHGKILKIHQIAVYHAEIIFSEYVDFFYAIKQKSSGIIREFSKKFLLNLYGKWGQLKQDLIELKEEDLDEYDEILNDNKDKLEIEGFCHVCDILGIGSIYKIDDKLYLQRRIKTKAKESLIAISAYITSLVRVYLISLIEIAGWENVFYTDTDSLFLNDEGLRNLEEHGLIGDKIGQLKIEGKGIGCFHAPKDYVFKDKAKIKGIKKKSIKLNETEYLNDEFESFSKAIKNQNFDNVRITKRVKKLSRIYKKGKILGNGRTIAFVI